MELLLSLYQILLLIPWRFRVSFSFFVIKFRLIFNFNCELYICVCFLILFVVIDGLKELYSEALKRNDVKAIVITGKLEIV